MSDSGLPSASAASPTSTNIDITTPAVVEWGSGDILCDVTFDARRLESTSEAFFKVRSTITLKASAPAKTPLFVFVHPERIRALSIDGREANSDDPKACAETAQKELGTDVVCLRFVLTKPADLVGPKTSDLTPKNHASGAILDSLRSLTTQDSFGVYIPRNALSQARLVALCEVASGGGLKSIGRQADLASLYRGKGGQVINEPDALDDASTASWNSPPSYVDVGPAPPLSPRDEPEAGPSKKRRLSGTDDVARDRIDASDVERLCRKIAEEQKAEMLNMMEEQSKLHERLLTDIRSYIDDKIELMEHRIVDYIEQRSSKLAEEQVDHLEERLEEIQDEVNDVIENRVNDVDEKVEDEFYGLRLRLEDYIQEELVTAEERIVENLQSSASISLQFNAS